jgi:phosphatidylglycerophosphatase A
VNWKLWIAQGFGVGRIPVAPGTFGSVLGFFYFAALLCTGSWIWVFAISIGILPLGVWLCDQGERALGKKDPGSVVLDEIVAIPFCYIAIVVFGYAWNRPEMCTAHPSLVFHWQTLIVFGLFRLFDVWKPWPVRNVQTLPGGLGIMVDDVLAALYVNVPIACFFAAGSTLDLPVPH